MLLTCGGALVFVTQQDADSSQASLYFYALTWRSEPRPPQLTHIWTNREHAGERVVPAPSASSSAHTHAFCPALVNHTVSSFAAVTRGERVERLAAAVSQIRVTEGQKCFQTPQNNEQDAVNHRDSGR